MKAKSPKRPRMHSFEAASDVDKMLTAVDALGFRQTALINEALRAHLPDVLAKMGKGRGEEKRAAA